MLPWVCSAFFCVGLVLVATAVHTDGSGTPPARPVPAMAVLVAVGILLGAWHSLGRRPSYFWRRLAGLGLVAIGLETALELLPLDPGLHVVLSWLISAMVVALVALLMRRRSGMKLTAPLFGVAAADALIVACLSTMAMVRWIELEGVILGFADLPYVLPLCANMLVGGVMVMVIVIDRDPLMVSTAVGVIVVCVVDSLTMIWTLAALPHPVWAYAVGVFGIVIVGGGLFHLDTPRRLTAENVAEGFEFRRSVVVWMVFALAVLVGVQSYLLEPGFQLRPLTPDVLIGGILLAVLLLTLAIRDATQSQRSRHILRRLRIQAGVDPLTGVGNRRALNDDVATLQPGQLAVLMVDLDKFKDVNDLVGHAAGDALLVQVAEQLRSAAGRVRARVYRMGGDEFAVLAPINLGQAARFARDLVEIIESNTGRIASGGHLRIGASVGIQYLESARPALVSEAIVAAGQAMREAKVADGASVRVFDAGLRERFERRMLIETRLRSYHEAVELAYQPIVDTRNGKVAGFEALARWKDPVLGRVGPDEFIQIAEHSGLIADLGRHLLARAVREFALEGGFGSGAFLSVNVSPLQLLAPDYTSSLLSELGHWQVRPDQILIEVTESVALAPETQVVDTMRALAQAGFQLGIDDFGAGSTSVSYLPALPLTTLKIDRRLTAGVDVKGAVILRGIVAMARGLDLVVIIEGVETLEQYHLAVAAGVPYTQGWLHASGRAPHEIFEPVGPFPATGGGPPLQS